MTNHICSFITLALFIFGSIANAQIGDDCFDPIVIQDPVDFCSADAAYSTVGLTKSGYEPAICFRRESTDIWFVFTAEATEVTIQIKGAHNINPGGTLQLPEAQLYYGSCGDVLTGFQSCGEDTDSDHLLEINQSGLIPGNQYFLRVQSGFSIAGSFRLCIRNYNAPVNPGSDCATSSLLCDKSSFIVQKVVGAGNDRTELDDAPCLNTGGAGQFNETNSTWFKWTADQAGTLTFSLSPLNEIDDLDFVLYELTNGINDCTSKEILRCMAAGESKENYPSVCHGPTGLRPSEDDINENAGCMEDQNNWLAPIEMEAGKSYALVVNNYTGSGSGFEVEFGGSGTFLGPQADFELTTTSCYDEPVEFQNTSSSTVGNIVNYEWFFGQGADPISKEGEGPHTVQFSSAGTKTILLKITSDQGCVTTISKNIDLKCCDPDIFADAGDDIELDLGQSFTLSGDAYLPGQDLRVQWSPANEIECPQCLQSMATPAQSGYFVLRVRDENGCRAVDSLFVNVFLNYPVYIPNAFSPNSDGINDFFTAYSNEAASKIDVQIFNRWGSLIFEARSIPPGVENLGWDGTFNGEKAGTGIYVYRIEIEYIDGTVRSFAGDLFLQR